MCSLGCIRSLGLALIPLAICCVVANLLLFFPNGETEFVRNNQLINYVWFFMGIGGGGIVVSIIFDLFIYIRFAAMFVIVNPTISFLSPQVKLIGHMTLEQL